MIRAAGSCRARSGAMHARGQCQVSPAGRPGAPVSTAAGMALLTEGAVPTASARSLFGPRWPAARAYRVRRPAPCVFVAGLRAMATGYGPALAGRVAAHATGGCRSCTGRVAAHVPGGGWCRSGLRRIRLAVRSGGPCRECVLTGWSLCRSGRGAVRGAFSFGGPGCGSAGPLKDSPRLPLSCSRAVSWCPQRPLSLVRRWLWCAVEWGGVVSGGCVRAVGVWSSGGVENVRGLFQGGGVACVGDGYRFGCVGGVGRIAASFEGVGYVVFADVVGGGNGECVRC